MGGVRARASLRVAMRGFDFRDFAAESIEATVQTVMRGLRPRFVPPAARARRVSSLEFQDGQTCSGELREENASKSCRLWVPTGCAIVAAAAPRWHSERRLSYICPIRVGLPKPRNRRLQQTPLYLRGLELEAPKTTIVSSSYHANPGAPMYLDDEELDQPRIG